MWLRVAQLTATASHIPKLPHIQPTQPLFRPLRSPRRFLQTNRLLILTKDIKDIHKGLDVTLEPPPKPAESQLTEDKADWRAILDSPDVRTIIERVNKIEQRTKDSSEQLTVAGSKYPPWLPLYLLYKKATTPQDILSSVELVYQQLPTVSARTSNALIIFAVAKLAERKYTATLRGFVWTFCQSSHTPSEQHFNFLLRALSLHPRSEETSVLVRDILVTMSQNNIRVFESTYDALLHWHFITLKVAAAVRRKMKHEKVLPTERHLKCILRLMVAHRFSRRAAGYLDAIHQLQRRKTECGDVTYGPKPRFLENIKATILNTRFLRSFRGPSSALRYIQELTTTQAKAPIRRFMFRKGKPRNLRRVWRRKNLHMHARDWISALYVASRTKNVTAQAFLTGYRQGAGAYAPNRQAYSTVVRGLLYKHDYANAAALWDESCSLDLPLDTISVGIGTHALAMNGEPHRAFALLEQVHSAQQAWVKEGKGRGRRNSRPPDRRPPAEVNLYAVHQLMVALRRMGRPDVVFALWDHMETLYGLSPDVYSLNIILQTARWARKYEDTIRGQLSYLGFGASAASSTLSLDPRAEAVSHIATTLNPAKKPWITGRWNTESAGQAALRVVVQMFLGNWPELRQAAPPVAALRRSSRDIALSPVSEAINTVTGRPPFEQSPLLSLFPAHAPIPYPQIFPTDVTLRAIVDLLPAESLHAEIPLVLVWVRMLGIRPSKATIATVLVHWMDVSMDSPLVERMKGLQRRNPYAQLVRWLEDWVGLRNMPGREEMSREMERSAYYKDVQYLDVIKERVSEAEGRLAVRDRSAYDE